MLWKCKSSRSQVFYKKTIFKNFTQVTGKCLCRSLFVNKVTAWINATLLESDFGITAFLLILQNL